VVPYHYGASEIRSGSRWFSKPTKPPDTTATFVDGYLENEPIKLIGIIRKGRVSDRKRQYGPSDRAFALFFGNPGVSPECNAHDVGIPMEYFESSQTSTGLNVSLGG
jgi:hypothetical protein